MEFLQIIVVLCGMSAQREACERYYWDCYMETRGHLSECIENSPFHTEIEGEAYDWRSAYLWEGPEDPGC